MWGIIYKREISAYMSVVCLLRSSVVVCVWGNTKAPALYFHKICCSRKLKRQSKDLCCFDLVVSPFLLLSLFSVVKEDCLYFTHSSYLLWSVSKCISLSLLLRTFVRFQVVRKCSFLMLAGRLEIQIHTWVNTRSLTMHLCMLILRNIASNVDTLYVLWVSYI